MATGEKATWPMISPSVDEGGEEESMATRERSKAEEERRVSMMVASGPGGKAAVVRAWILGWSEGVSGRMRTGMADKLNGI